MLLSVRLSRTQRIIRELKFGRKVPHLWCDSRNSFKVKGQDHEAHKCWHTSCAISSENGKAYELKTCYTDGERRLASAIGAMTSKVKGQGRKVTWLVWAVLAQCCTCVIRGRRGNTVSAEPGGHTSCLMQPAACQWSHPVVLLFKRISMTDISRTEI